MARVPDKHATKHLRLKASTLDTYASAFEHLLMNEARQWLGK